MNARYLAAWSALLLLASGCLPAPYRPPTAAQPHAILKLRRTYQTSGGTNLRELATLDTHPALGVTDASTSASAPRIDAILVHPRIAELGVSSTFFHTETRLVHESYQQQVSYSESESYSCGSGTSYRTCTRLVTRYRNETRYRDVLRQVEVTDGACATALWVAPVVNASYLVEYEYIENNVCRLACFEQAPGAEPGTFQNRPCPYPSAAEQKRSLEAR